VQLESFRGILCATTNRFEDLDPAFMRRFDMKIELGYLTADQRVQMFRSTLRSGGCVKRLNTGICSRLDALESLTPGDFTTAQRKLRISRQELTQETLLSALVHEVECKQVNNGRPIGFRWVS
jgi:transitional endoplasmic reticulum ATPase